MSIDPVKRMALHLHLAADNCVEPGHPDADMLRDIAERLVRDGAGNYDVRRLAHALLYGELLPAAPDPLPEPGDVILGALAEQLPVGAVVYREDIIHQYGRREHVQPGRWSPEIAPDVEYRVATIPAPRIPA